MTRLEYLHLSEISPADFLPILNKATTREHLIQHPVFDESSVTQWIAAKIDVDQTPGCRVRALRIDGTLAGWCGIQLEDGRYELAIVIDDSCWGVGKRVFAELMRWSVAFSHQTVLIHLLDTRREYRFLHKMASRVYATEMLGNRFTTYELDVSRF